MRKKILVIDDELAILELMQIIFEDAGYTVEITDTTDSVTLLLEGELPHVILLDLLLSGKDSSDLVRKLKGQERTRHIPLLVFSAAPCAEQEALEAGADAFLAKPFELEELLAKVASYLSVFSPERLSERR